MPKILVADDSITVRKVAERLLTEAGMEVALAASGEEAMAYLSTEHPDFVISDVIMPDKSGYDVCRFVRSQQALAHTPVLLISGIVNEEVNRQAESCRADGVLKKPFQGSSLQERVKEMLAKHVDGAGGDSLSVPPPSTAETPEVPHAGSPSSGATAKVYRITEEQLQSFREASARIKELEALLEEERARSARLVEPRQEGADTARLEELERSLADSTARIEALTGQVQRLGELERRNGDLERHNQELEATISELRDRPVGTAAPCHEAGHHATVADLQALLAEQQKRLAELADELLRHGEAGQSVKDMEAAVADERARADALADRCAALEQRLADAHRRIDTLTNRLAHIARLAELTDESSPAM